MSWDRDRREDPDLVSRRLHEATGAQSTLRCDPRDEVRIDVSQPEHESRAHQDRDGVPRIGSVLFEEHEDREVGDGAVDGTGREMLLADPFTVAHVGRTVVDDARPAWFGQISIRALALSRSYSSAEISPASRSLEIFSISAAGE